MNGRRILCPYCMHERQLGTEIIATYDTNPPPGANPPGGLKPRPAKEYWCGGPNGCRAKIPVAYVDDYDTVTRVYCPQGGLPNHGKTVFLISLLVELADRGPGLWGTSNLPQGEGIHDVIEWMRLWRTEGQLPPSTVLGALPNCIVLRMAGFPTMPLFHLMLQDASGEILHDEARIRNAYFLTNAPLIVLFVSLPDLQKDGLHMNESVLGLYVNALRSAGMRLGLQSLLVVLTKGDQLIDQLPLAARTTLHAAPDELYGTRDPAADAERRETLSRALEEWLVRQPSVGQAVLSAREVFAEVKYCVVSATGHEPERRANGRYLREPASPRAMFDPLSWIIDLHRDRPQRLRLAAELEAARRRASPPQREEIEAAEAALRRGHYEIADEQVRRIRAQQRRRFPVGLAVLVLAVAAAGVIGWRLLGGG